MVMSLYDRIQNAIKGIRTNDVDDLVNVKELGACNGLENLIQVLIDY